VGGAHRPATASAGSVGAVVVGAPPARASWEHVCPSNQGSPLRLNAQRPARAWGCPLRGSGSSRAGVAVIATGGSGGRIWRCRSSAPAHQATASLSERTLAKAVRWPHSCMRRRKQKPDPASSSRAGNPQRPGQTGIPPDQPAPTQDQAPMARHCRQQPHLAADSAGAGRRRGSARWGRGDRGLGKRLELGSPYRLVTELGSLSFKKARARLTRGNRCLHIVLGRQPVPALICLFMMVPGCC